MIILITGGSGFLGGRIASYLSDNGHQIILASRSINEPPVWLPGAKVVKVLWDDFSCLSAMCKGVDIVIHAAGSNAKDCSHEPVAALDFNGLATARLVRAAELQAVKKFFYFSTSHVYGSPLSGRITEKTCPQNIHPYATSHLAGELSVRYAGSRSNMEGIVLRLTNVVGAPMHVKANCWMLVANDLCRQVIEYGRMHLLGDGEDRRDFISISEVCRVLVELVNFKNSAQISAQDLLNLGSGKTLKTSDLALIIQERAQDLLEYKPDILFGNKRSHASNYYYVNEGLEKLGIIVKDRIKYEIDTLLAFSKKNFTY